MTGTPEEAVRQPAPPAALHGSAGAIVAGGDVTASSTQYIEAGQAFVLPPEAYAPIPDDAAAGGVSNIGTDLFVGRVDELAVAAFLRPRPVRELPGVGAKTAVLLGDYGLHTVGDVADVPQPTLQRLLGARAGRTLHERAHGHDTAVVNPSATPVSLSVEHRFARDELAPTAQRRALLALADELGTQLRASGQIAQGLTCTVRYADASATRRGRTLPEATFHTVLLARTAYSIYDSFGLQRARVRSIALRADALQPADRATRQLTLDARDDKPLAIEAVADRARARYGHQMIYPAALAISSRPPSARQRDRSG